MAGQVQYHPGKASGSDCSPLAPVLRGEGSGVRGLRRGSFVPLTPDASPPKRGRGEIITRPSPKGVVVQALLVVLSLSLMLAGCDWPGKPDPADRPKTPEDVLAFATLYGRNCAGCHGAEGKLGPAPPLNDPLFRAIMPEKTLHVVIARGRAGTPMPAFAKEYGGELTTAQVQVLVNEIKGVPYRIKKDGEERDIAPAWGVPTSSTGRVPAYLAPAVKPEQSGEKRGQAGAMAFARACASCHGDLGQGIEREGRLRRQIHNQAFLALISDQALRRYAITGRPDLGMPSFAEKKDRTADFVALTSEEVTDLVAFLASWRAGAPASGK
ncbi:MAG TPA: c-type cytochrome [Gemmataceae bacterium]|nr:c-type cytochrome [Gemmataceae bacterium]